MIKKLLILFFALALAGVAGWYVQFGPKNVAVDINDINLSDSAALNNNPQENNKVGGGTAVSEEIQDPKALALKIIERPIIVTAKLSEEAKQQAVAKIQQISESIKNYYDEVYQWYDLGAYRRLIGDYDGAIEAWAFGSVIRPQDYIFYENLGDLYAFYLNNYVKGEESFLQALQRNPQSMVSYQQLAILYEFSLKDMQRAENILLLGIKENPEATALKILLGQHYLRNGRKADAIKYFEEALALSPDNKALREDLAALKQ